jgi:hypothetical protein
MLIFLIPALWLTIVAFFVLLCRGAARADSEMLVPVSPARTDSRLQRHGALTLFEDRRGTVSGGSRVRGEGVFRGFRGRGVRGRAGRCVAGS